MSNVYFFFIFFRCISRNIVRLSVMSLIELFSPNLFNHFFPIYFGMCISQAAAVSDRWIYARIGSFFMQVF